MRKVRRLEIGSIGNFVVVVILCFAAFAPVRLFAQDSTLIAFKIEDQFDQAHSDQDYRESIVIIIGSDKNGSKYNGVWSKAIRDSLKQEMNFARIKFLNVADVRSVPFFIKGFVKGKFPKEKERWVLLDWKGRLAKAYNFVSEACNIVIFDRNGVLVYKTHGHELDLEKLAVICEKLRLSMMESSGPGGSG
ncbi:hypothetical protein L0244_37880 [bacterium]|nr:hypothetical protein [bacterium]